ncbi:hypothetical protein JCM10908_007354 [Rhodotorula pacifica]|uniref:uncharacterized protein n=1 Tax=Rhodotorula pacifica TaxID=1495444 RepID=UPI00316F6086
MLSTLSASVSTYFSRSTSTAPIPAEDEASPLEQPTTRVTSTGEDSPEPRDHDSPHTPEQHSSIRYSPNSLSQSGNQTMASVLSAHPHFSVFRKSTSLQSLDQLARRREEEEQDSRVALGQEDPSPVPPRLLAARRSFSVHDLRNEEGDLVETLITPPPSSTRSSLARVAARLSDSPTSRTGAGRNSSSSEASFHLDSAELPSLNFGDQSSSAGSRGPSPVASPSLAAGPSPPSALGAFSPGTPIRPLNTSTSTGQTSGIRLVPDSPPTTTSARTQTPIRRETFTRSASGTETATMSSTSAPASTTSNKMRSSTSTGAKGPIERVQFSPLGLCPSPLLTAPTLPPPPPPPPPTLPLLSALSTPPTAAGPPSSFAFDSPVAQTLSRKGSNGILKAPKTPGTGRSVRFSASTVERTVERWMTPPEDGPGELDEAQGAVDGEEADADVSPCQLAEHHHPTTKVPTPISATTHNTAEGAQDAESASSAALVNLSFSSASFLSKLQAVIPSPDCSLEPTLSPPTPTAVDLPAVEDSPSVAEASSDTETVEALVPLSQKRPRARLSLMDESNPFWSMQLSATLEHETSNAREGTEDASLASTAASALAASEGSTSTTAVERHEVSAMTISQASIEAGARGAGAAEEEATLLMQASLLRGSLIGGGVGGGPSFGGQSFVEVSHLNAPALARPVPNLAAALLEPVDEFHDDEGEATRIDNGADSAMQTSSTTEVGNPRTSTDLAAPASAPRLSGLPTSAGTPSRPSPWSLPSTTPRRPSPLTQEAEFSFASNTSASASVSAASQSVMVAPAPLHESDLSHASASPLSITGTILDESAGSLVEIRPIDPSPPPAYQPAAATPSSPAAQSPPVNAPTAPTAAPSSSSSSFYRQFMAARARDGLSQSAKEEWDRLERGEKASPKDEAGRGLARDSEAADESRLDGEQSVYWSPQKADASSEGFDEEGKSVYVDAEQAESSLVEIEGARAAFLSPIAEVTEPESDANTPLDKEKDRANRSSQNRRIPPTQPAFRASLPPQSLPVVPGTPGRAGGAAHPPATPRSASKIPRPRNPITPSQNPFLLQLARTTTNSQAGSLLHDLFSTQEDQLAASASQRFLLSSLVTNLQDEVEQKNAMVTNLKRQVEQARAEAREIEQLAIAWERRAQASAPNQGHAQLRSPADAKKLVALEETVRLLADELETRMREDRSRRRELETELERTRADLVHAVNEHRDVAIRYKHAVSAQQQTEEERAAAQAAQMDEEARHREAEREREELRARWRIDAEERDRVVALLRDELASLRSSSSTPKTDDDFEREVQRRADLATQASARNVQLVQHELVQRDAALDDLRQQLQASRDEATRLTRSVQEERQHAELASADLEGLLAIKEQELEELARDRLVAQEQLDDALARLDAVETERDHLANTLSSKEAEFAQQTEQTQSALNAMAELESAVARVEHDLAIKERELQQTRSDLADHKRESDSVLEKRDRVLAEAEREAGRLRKDLEATRGENARLSELVGKLRLDSADREVKVAKLKKRTAELEEDVFGLNIALDAKQQEASHWKRQMSQLKLAKERQSASADELGAVPSTAIRNTLAATVPSSAMTATTTRKSVSRRRSHATTPFPSEKTRPRREADHLRQAAAADSTANESASHDLTLPPLHDGNEETPSRPAATTMRPQRRSSVSIGLGLPRAVSDKSRSRPSSAESKENEAPPTARRREAILA